MLSHNHDEIASRGTMCPQRSARSARSLQTCHRFAHEPVEHKPPRDSGAYVPEIAARLDDDRNLTDGAKRCARKIAELTYQRNRDGRYLEVTVTYLAKALGRCRRSVQRYLRQLERGGYLRVNVVAGERSRLCLGVVIDLLAPLFPRHRQKNWPRQVGFSGATRESLNQSFFDSYRGKVRRFSVYEWSLKCMDGVFRTLMQTDPLKNLPFPTLG